MAGDALIVLVAAPIFFGEAFILLWVATKVRSSTFGSIFALTMSLGAAFALMIAVLRVFLTVVGFFSELQIWPIVAWSILALAAFMTAEISKAHRLLIAIPFWIVAVIATTTIHFIVGAIMVAAGFLVLIVVPRLRRRKGRVVCVALLGGRSGAGCVP